ncbi:MAG TPA: argininosuccinate synthase [Candidatus Nitrosocosmicus sp.]|nr:argininosuccinate synthase [Candidatus Nitrosocosmicus sp.]
MNKVILAFSGGLDTSVCVKYLQTLHNLDVITLTVDVGQNDDFKEISRVSTDLGAVEHVYVDAKQEFLSDYVTPSIQANALYQQKYPLATAIARPLIAKKAVEVAKEHNADVISHGCTGKGNDQVRFDIAIRSLNPNLNIIAPIRDMNLTRDKELEYANENNIRISEVAKKYSIDENLWGRAIEGGSLENLENEPPDDAFKFVKQNNTSAGYVSIGFEKGLPISIDGVRMELDVLVKKLSDIAGSFGVGIIDHIEDRVIGIKSREVYEAPAALVLIEAHKDLEKLVLTNNELRFKFNVDDQWAWLAYSGLWLDPLLTDLNAFIAKTQERVTGEIKIKMHNGSYRVVGRKSTFSLYDNDTITYTSNSNFDQRLATGFVTFWGLQSSAANAMICKNKA